MKKPKQIHGVAVALDGGKVAVWLSVGNRVESFEISPKMALLLIGRLAAALAKTGGRRHA